VDVAKQVGQPVFAFSADPDAPWTGLREEGRLVSETEKAAMFKGGSPSSPVLSIWRHAS
jgi:hypothetical protein